MGKRKERNRQETSHLQVVDFMWTVTHIKSQMMSHRTLKNNNNKTKNQKTTTIKKIKTKKNWNGCFEGIWEELEWGMGGCDHIPFYVCMKFSNITKMFKN